MTGTGAVGKPADDAGVLITLRESPPAVKALLAGVFINKLGMFIQIFLVLFLTTRGFTGLQAGAALGAYGAGSVVGVLAGGALTDRLGARSTILLGMAGTAAFILAVLYLQHYPSLLVAVAVVGAVSQVYRPASAALLSELTPEHRQVMIFALYRFALNVGTTAAPLVGTALLAVSYDLLFWAQAAAALGYAVIAMVALPRRARAPAAAEAGQPAPGGDGYLAVLGDRRYLLYLAAMFVNSAVYVQYLSVLPLAMLAAGLTTIWYSAMITLNGLLVISCELLVTKIVQRWPMKTTVLVGFTLLGSGLAIYALPGGLAVFAIGTLVWTMAEIVGGPTMFAYPATASPARLRGRYIGAAHAMFGLGFAVGPIAGVAVWQLAGRAVWVYCGLACVLGIAAAWNGMVRKSRPPDEAPPAEELEPATDVGRVARPAPAA